MQAESMHSDCGIFEAVGPILHTNCVLIDAHTRSRSFRLTILAKYRVLFAHVYAVRSSTRYSIRDAHAVCCTYSIAAVLAVFITVIAATDPTVNMTAATAINLEYLHAIFRSDLPEVDSGRPQANSDLPEVGTDFLINCSASRLGGGIPLSLSEPLDA